MEGCEGGGRCEECVCSSGLGHGSRRVSCGMAVLDLYVEHGQATDGSEEGFSGLLPLYAYV